ncbi:MAG: PEGA domain-containing protein [Patescibacteria group bacterium]
MSRSVRRIIFIVFVLCFIATSIAVTLFAAGYRYNVTKQRFEKTGLIRVESVPRDAIIFVNGKQVRERTPARLARLLPGEYVVRLEKTGYLPWERRLEVQSGVVTFAGEIKLFRDEVPTLAVPGEIRSLSLSPDGNSLAYALQKPTGTEVWIRNLSQNTDELILQKKPSAPESRASGKPETVAFSRSKHGDVLITISGEVRQYFLASGNNPSPLLDLQKNRAPLARVAWGTDEETLEGFVRTVPGRGTLLRINQKTGERTVIASPVPEEVYLRNEVLYAILGTASAPRLTRRNVGAASAQTVLSLPAGAYSFLRSREPHLTLFNARDSRVLVIEPENETPLRLTLSAKETRWQDGGELLSWNDFEIWTSDAARGESRLLARYGETVRSAALHAGWPYLFGGWGNLIRAIDLDTREPRNVVELVKATEIRDFTIGADGKKLYFTGTIGNTKGIFSLQLR